MFAQSKNTGMVLEGYDMFGLNEGEGECNLSDDSADDDDEVALVETDKAHNITTRNDEGQQEDEDDGNGSDV